jgi:hypothetical protein
MLDFGLQVLNKEGIPISMNALDAEVCEIVGVAIDDNCYCRLGRRDEFPDSFEGEMDYLRSASNWYDTIGCMIARENKSFQDVLEYYADAMKDFIGKKDNKGNVITLETIYPYHTKVLNTWIEKGYVAKQVKF